MKKEREILTNFVSRRLPEINRKVDNTIRIGTVVLVNSNSTVAKIRIVSTGETIDNVNIPSGISEVRIGAKVAVLCPDVRNKGENYIISIFGGGLQKNTTQDSNDVLKVLSTKCKCRAYLNAAQTNTASGSNVKVLLDTVTYDVGENFDTANSRFSAPVNGYYLVCGMVGFSGLTANKRYMAQIWVNGSQYAAGGQSIGTDVTNIRVAVSDIVYANMGEFIELYSFHNDGTSTSDLLNASLSTYMAIHLLSV